MRTVGAATGPFLTAGPHLAAPDQVHGEHVGDLPPIYVQADGTARASARTDAFAVADLLDADGTAAMVHAAPDNLASIPGRYRSSADGASPSGPDAATLDTGDSGGRVACGVVEGAAAAK